MNDGKTSEYINNFSKAKKEILRGTEEKRPTNPDDCKSLTDANKWRLSIMIELSDYIRIIQNAALGESKIRILNDTINDYLKVKDAWEERIKALGGEDWKQLKSDVDETCFKHGDYTYWGAARYLPGVRELFTKQTQLIDVKTDKNFSKEFIQQKYKLDSKYYGENYENDDILMEEKELEIKLRSEIYKNSQDNTNTSHNNVNDEVDSEFIKYMEINSWYNSENNFLFDFTNEKNIEYYRDINRQINMKNGRNSIKEQDKSVLEQYLFNTKKNELIEKILIS